MGEVLPMSAEALRFPDNFPHDEPYTDEALAIFCRQSGYAQNCSFVDLTAVEQRTVLHLAQKLKAEAQK